MSHLEQGPEYLVPTLSLGGGVFHAIKGEQFSYSFISPGYIPQLQSPYLTLVNQPLTSGPLCFVIYNSAFCYNNSVLLF